MLTAFGPLLAPIAGFLAFFGILFTILGAANSRRNNPIQQRIQQATMTNLTPEEIELQRPFAERFLRPFTAQLARGVTRLTPSSVLENLQLQLIQAGQGGRMQASDFIALRIFTTLLGIGMGIGSGALIQRGLTGYVLFLAIFGGLGYFLPGFWLRGEIDKRKLQITNALPDVIDLLTVSVEAGLSFDQAVYYIVTKSNSLLAREFDRYLREKNIGVSNAQALRNLVERTGVEDLSAFVGALIQAEETGTRLGWVLRIQAVEMRVRRRQRAQAQAQQAPIKMIFPLVLLIFPPILIVVLGPAIPRILHLLAPGLAL